MFRADGPDFNGNVATRSLAVRYLQTPDFSGDLVECQSDGNVQPEQKAKASSQWPLKSARAA